MEHTILYYDFATNQQFTINIDILENDTNFSFLKEENTIKVLVFDPLPNQYFKKIVVPYVVELWNKEFTQKMSGTHPQKQAVSDLYSEFWNIPLDVAMPNGTTLGSFENSGGTNLVLQEYWNDENCIAYDKSKGYEPIQPVNYKMDVTGTSAAADVKNADESKTLLFSLDDEQYNSVSSFENLEIGSHFLKAKYSENPNCIFKVDFEIVE